MNESGRILIADEEETFLNSTADLLQREGYECDCVTNANATMEKLREGSYDLLITGIHMPGNSELELIKALPDVAEGMPVILVTGNPSLETAIQSIQLPVAAYVDKPLDFAKLLMHVRNSINKYRTYRSFQTTSKRLQEWHKDMDNIVKLMNMTSQDTSSINISTFFVLTFRNIVDALSDLQHLIDKLAMNSDERSVCNLLDCPRLIELRDGLVESVDTLKKTKSSFKSKDLGMLRKKLEELTRTMAE